jgi:hypothetical protein
MALDLDIAIPLPLQLVIDDVGWASGRDGSAEGQPYRAGIARDHVAADYRAIADLGRALGMRPQCHLVLGDWDVDNLLRATPSASWEGAMWDNRPRLGPWLDDMSRSAGNPALPQESSHAYRRPARPAAHRLRSTPGERDRLPVSAEHQWNQDARRRSHGGDAEVVVTESSRYLLHRQPVC